MRDLFPRPRGLLPPRRFVSLLVVVALAACERSAPTVEKNASGDIVLSTVDNLPCTLELEPTGIRLRSDAAGSVPDPMWPVARAPDGRFFTSTRPQVGKVAIWSARGEFIRTFGRRGPGPGEFGVTIAPRVDQRGIVHVFDFASSRWQRFTQNGEFLAAVTSRVIGPPENLAIVGNDSVLSSMPFADRQFHIVDGAGNVLNSFGEPGHEPDVEQRRPIAYTGNRTFWAAPRHASLDYVLEEWTLDGELARRIVRNVPWLPDASAAAASERDLPIYQLYAGAHGLLLVSVQVKHPEESEDHTGVVWYEVIDPRVPEVLASRRVQYDAESRNDASRIWGVFPGTQLSVFEHEGDLGLPIVQIMRYRLTVQTGRCPAD